MDKYDFIFSLGRCCHTSMILRAENLQCESFPLDWLKVYMLLDEDRKHTKYSGFDTAMDLLLSDFKDFCNKEDLLIRNNNNLFHEWVYNKRNGLSFFHDLPKGESIENGWSEVQKKYQRRIEKFLNRMENSEKVLAVYTQNTYDQIYPDLIAPIPDDILKSYWNKLCQKYPGKILDLLIFEHKKNMCGVISKEIKCKEGRIIKIISDHTKIKDNDIYARMWTDPKAGHQEIISISEYLQTKVGRSSMQKEIPIFISGDENYAPYIAVLIASACYNTKSFLKFYIIGDPIFSFTRKQIESMKNKFNNFDIEFLDIDMEKEFSSFRQASSFAAAPYWSNTTYARILIPKLKPDIKKVINLDADVIVLGDLQKMIDVDLDGYALGGVPDNYMINQCLAKGDNYMDFSKEMLEKYFNAGVLIFDCDIWREKNIIEELFKIQAKYKNKLKYVEQDLLNKYFDNNFKLIGIEVNLMNSSISTLMNCPQKYKGLAYRKWDCIIRHFEGPMKPWHYNERSFSPSFTCNTISFEEFWFYASMTPFFEGLKMKFQSKRFF